MFNLFKIEFYFTSETIYTSQPSQLYFHYFFAIPNSHTFILSSLEQYPSQSSLSLLMAASSQHNIFTDQDAFANIEEAQNIANTNRGDDEVEQRHSVNSHSRA